MIPIKACIPEEILTWIDKKGRNRKQKSNQRSRTIRYMLYSLYDWEKSRKKAYRLAKEKQGRKRKLGP